MKPAFLTIILLSFSNIFMTFAWYGHLKHLNAKPWYIAAILSWFVALFEYLLQVPANRIGFSSMDLPQLKIMQEIITILIFIPFALFYMRQPWKTDYFYAFLCILGAVYFTFKS
ncbi:MAG: hypothetical protein C4560_06260 [Nitrospiraceae bacterium]|nr:MAG: hypothetical protein C4560_06260 [Nitrospiraceae bacterium]